MAGTGTRRDKSRRGAAEGATTMRERRGGMLVSTRVCMLLWRREGVTCERCGEGRGVCYGALGERVVQGTLQRGCGQRQRQHSVRLRRRLRRSLLPSDALIVPAPAAAAAVFSCTARLLVIHSCRRLRGASRSAQWQGGYANCAHSGGVETGRQQCGRHSAYLSAARSKHRVQCDVLSARSARRAGGDGRGKCELICSGRAVCAM